MSTSKSNGRDDKGRFVKGNAGRPKGAICQSTIDGRILRQRLIESWDEVDGDEILRKIAKESPVAYCRLILSVLPKQIEADVNMGYGRTAVGLTVAAQAFQKARGDFSHKHKRPPTIGELRDIRLGIPITDEDLGIEPTNEG